MYYSSLVAIVVILCYINVVEGVKHVHIRLHVLPQVVKRQHHTKVILLHVRDGHPAFHAPSHKNKHHPVVHKHEHKHEHRHKHDHVHHHNKKKKKQQHHHHTKKPKQLEHYTKNDHYTFEPYSEDIRIGNEYDKKVRSVKSEHYEEETARPAKNAEKYVKGSYKVREILPPNFQPAGYDVNYEYPSKLSVFPESRDVYGYIQDDEDARGNDDGDDEFNSGLNESDNTDNYDEGASNFNSYLDEN